MIVKAHVFQHNYTGVQIFVFHFVNEIQAKQKFTDIVNDADDWIYLGKKSVNNSQIQFGIRLKVLSLHII